MFCLTIKLNVVTKPQNCITHNLPLCLYFVVSKTKTKILNENYKNTHQKAIR